MNQKGQGLNVFGLLIFAIIALGIIFLLTNFFLPQPSDALKEFRDSLDLAQANIGISRTYKISLDAKTAFSAKNVFDTPLRSVSFQCTQQECAQHTFEVTAREIVVKEKIVTSFTTRCTLEKNLYNCRIYFGTPPAQIMMSQIQTKQQYDLDSETIKLDFFVENTGSQNAIDVKTEAKIFVVERHEGITVQNLYEQPLTDTTPSIGPGESRRKTFLLPIKDAGNFFVEVKTSAVDAGEQTQKLEFGTTKSVLSENCAAGQKMETFLNETLNKCVSRYSCSGCEKAFECAARWQEKETLLVFESSSKETALSMSEPVNGQCQ